MIKKLRIKNFQKHHKLDIDFSDKVTTIVGKSDAGKSSVLRSLLWLISNKPKGDSFIQVGEKSAAVRIETDGHVITRRKGKSNTYEIDGEELHSFGSDVPQKVQDVLKMGDINYQGQHDPPFWLSDSAGQVSRNLNRIVDLGIIDRSFSNVSQRLRKSKTENEIIQKRIDSSTEEKNNLEWTVQATEDFTVIKSSSDKIRSLNSKIDELENTISRIKSYQQDLDRSLAIQESLQLMIGSVDSITESRDKIEQLQYSIEDMESILDEIKENKRIKSETDKIIKDLNQQIQSIEICELCQRPL
jgi:DNA repair ATPase RecN